jgi:RNA polymerase sigma-70 factor (ECF subfamily)
VNGDVGAWEVLVRRHQQVAYRTAHVIAGGAEDAQDAAQAGLLKAWRSLHRFDPDRPFRPWLLTIVGNEARNMRRSAGRRAGLALRLRDGRPSDGAAPPPEVAAFAHGDRDALLAAVNRLRQEDREVIGLRYLLELSEAETADALGWPRGTVKSRLSRALDRLRTELAGTSGLEGVHRA